MAGSLHGALLRRTQRLLQRTPSPQRPKLAQRKDGSSAAKMVLLTCKKLKLRAMGSTVRSRSKWYTSIATIAASCCIQKGNENLITQPQMDRQ
jgi:hypothetical protein